MSIDEIRTKFEAGGMPYPISEREAKAVRRDIYSLPGDNRFDYIDIAIRERMSLFVKQQVQIEEQIERRRKFLKPAFVVEYV
jgi:hypothetical protein